MNKREILDSHGLKDKDPNDYDFYNNPDRGKGRPPGGLVHRDARIEPGVLIGPDSVVCEGAEVGANTTIGARTMVGRARIGRDVTVGDDSKINDFCGIGNDSSTGAQLTLHSGAWI